MARRYREEDDEIEEEIVITAIPVTEAMKAAQAGDIAQLSQGDFGVHLCHRAARYGQLETLKWLYDHRCPWNSFTAVHAVWGGHPEIVAWIKEIDGPISWPDLAGACRHGRLRTWHRSEKAENYNHRYPEGYTRQGAKEEDLLEEYDHYHPIALEDSCLEKLLPLIPEEHFEDVAGTFLGELHWSAPNEWYEYVREWYRKKADEDIRVRYQDKYWIVSSRYPAPNYEVCALVDTEEEAREQIPKLSGVKVGFHAILHCVTVIPH